MRRLAAMAAVAALVALAASLAACPSGGGVAKPAPVELEWPDAATLQVAPADAGPVGL